MYSIVSIVSNTVLHTCPARHSALIQKFILGDIQHLKVAKRLSLKVLTTSEKFVTRLCCCSVPKSCPTLCDPRDCSTPGFPVLHYHPELGQTHVHPVSDDIQPSDSLSSPSPSAFNLSQHQSILQ